MLLSIQGPLCLFFLLRILSNQLKEISLSKKFLETVFLSGNWLPFIWEFFFLIFSALMFFWKIDKLKKNWALTIQIFQSFRLFFSGIFFLGLIGLKFCLFPRKMIKKIIFLPQNHHFETGNLDFLNFKNFWVCLFSRKIWKYVFALFWIFLMYFLLREIGYIWWDNRIKF